jgi:HEAT repeat protein
MQRLFGMPGRLGLQPGEARLVGLFFLIAFGNGITRTFARSAAYALFLAAFAAQALPYVYLIISVTLVLISFGYLRLARRTSLARLLPGTLALLSLIFLGAWAGIIGSSAAWIVFGLVVLYETSLVMTNLALWNSVGRLLNVQQVKRLSGMISSGEPIAAVAGGLLMAPIVARIGTPNLLLVAAGALLFSLGAAAILARSFGAQLAPRAEPVRPAAQAQPPRRMPSRYIGLTLLFYSLVIISYYLIDNLFYTQNQIQFPNTADLAGFIGLFNAVVAVVWTLTNAFVISGALRRFGLSSVLLIAPAVLALSTLALIGFSGIGLLAAVFVLATLNKLLSKLSLDGFVKVALNVIYQPLPTSQRLQVQGLTEGVVYAGALGITGALLLALTNLLGFSTLSIAAALLLTIMGWLALAWLLFREYPRQLLRALTRRALGQTSELILDDPASQAVLRRALSDPQPGVVIYALHTLARTNALDLRSTLPNLFSHPAAAVREEALLLAEAQTLKPLLNAVQALAHNDPDPVVRGTAARVAAVLGNTPIRADIVALLSSPEAPIRCGAAIGLLRRPEADAFHARRALTRWIAAPDPDERKVAAEAIGKAGDPSHAPLLCDLLTDSDLAVRRAAIEAAGRLANAELWPLVITALGIRSTAGVATAALVAGGIAVLPALVAAAGAASSAAQGRMARVCGRIGGAEAHAVLLAWLDHPDADVRTQVFAALNQADYRPVVGAQPPIHQQLRREVGAAGWIIAAQVACPATTELLVRALDAEVAAARNRVLYLLGLLGDPPTIRRARHALESAAAEQRAYGLEIIDTQLSGELKAPVLALLSDMQPAQQRIRLAAFAPPGPATAEAWLPALISAPAGQLQRWTQACAIAAAAFERVVTAPDRTSPVDVVPAITPHLNMRDPLLAETAAWALKRLVVDHESEGSPAMLSRIEKVLILKAVGIFAETPDAVLADIAELVQETEIPAGTQILAQGEEGTSMYVIVDGRVRVHDGNHVLNYLAARDVFGEMALLDPEPRIASVTAESDTRLLRLDQEPFYELMDERNEVARGVIRVLTRHLRARVRDLGAARVQLSDIAANSSQPALVPHAGEGG